MALLIIIADAFYSSVTTAASHIRSRASGSCAISPVVRHVRPLRSLGYVRTSYICYAAKLRAVALSAHEEHNTACIKQVATSS